MSDGSKDEVGPAIQVGVVPAGLRIDYGRGQLDESSALPDAIDQFDRWFGEVLSAGVVEANAMTLATVSASGQPSARVVLLKDFDRRGFTFYTNYLSRKGRELAGNPRACLNFYWQPLERQVRIDGTVERVSREESERYFHSRPVAAQVGAWVSRQSETVASRQELEGRYAELAARLGEGPVPLPGYWGGYRLVPSAIEFWQGRPSRLHDRLLYTRNEAAGWTLTRLSP